MCIPIRACLEPTRWKLQRIMMNYFKHVSSRRPFYLARSRIPRVRCFQRNVYPGFEVIEEQSRGFGSWDIPCWVTWRWWSLCNDRMDILWKKEWNGEFEFPLGRLPCFRASIIPSYRYIESGWNMIIEYTISNWLGGTSWRKRWPMPGSNHPQPDLLRWSNDPPTIPKRRNDLGCTPITTRWFLAPTNRPERNEKHHVWLPESFYDTLGTNVNKALNAACGNPLIVTILLRFFTVWSCNKTDDNNSNNGSGYSITISWLLNRRISNTKKSGACFCGERKRTFKLKKDFHFQQELD